MTVGGRLRRAAASIGVVVAMFAGMSVAAPYASAGTLAQTSSTMGTVDVGGSSSFTTTVMVSGNTGPDVTFGDSSPAPTNPGLEINPSTGVITTTGPLPVSGSPYTIGGSITDTYGDASGTWQYSLAVTADNISQNSSTTGTTDVGGSSSFTTTVTTTGSTGPVTFGDSSPAPTNPGLEINPSTGVITTTGPLPVSGSPYTIGGSITDTYGDTSGTWQYSLAVTADSIAQSSSTTGTTDVGGSHAYTTTVDTSGGTGTVTFSVSSTPSTPGLRINDTTGVITTTGTLPASGTAYTISGNDSDGDGDSGSWSYSLTVTGDSITQSSSTTGTTDVGGSLSYTTTVATTGGTGSVTFSVTSTPSTPGLKINDSTGVITTTGTLPASGTAYTISGDDSDGDGDSGSWSYSLTVTTDTIVQGSPTSDSVASNRSATFTSTLNATSGFVGTVTFATSTPGFTINSDDQLASTGALAASGTPYAISGTDLDAYGDTGTWTFALTVLPSNTVVSITQTSATTGTTTSALSATFVPGPIVVENNVGPVNFVTSVSSAALSVSSSGNITTTGTLKAGNYTVSGTDSDAQGDVGTWTYTLTVTAVVTTVTFNANDGSGSMTPENASIPTPLSLNTFVRPGYSFVDWNTAANGSGTKYANGASYPFSASITLYAQWKLGKPVTHIVIFDGNAGSGFMASERENTPTGLSLNTFTRAGYFFLDWNTAANGSGATYANGATYSFKSSVVLFAQWRKIPKAPTVTVTFNAHGGKGTMSAERHVAPAALSSNAFTRTGFTFVDWNTSANGSGASFANHAIYSFDVSLTLYAQWKVHHVVAPPAVDATASVGPFARKSSNLSSALEVQVNNLADEIKANHDTKVVLTGYGDRLTAANELNEAIWAANFLLSQLRASVVDTYLKLRLSALGIKGVTVSSMGDGSATPGSGGKSSQANSDFVIAALT
jgi:uncharacterized repeat protein (TIGR02543 family)